MTFNSYVVENLSSLLENGLMGGLQSRAYYMLAVAAFAVDIVIGEVVKPVF